MWIFKCFLVFTLSVLVTCEVDFLWDLLPQRQRSGGNTPPPFDHDPNSSYGPNRWREHFPDCAGFRQSPINIETKNPALISSTFKINGLDEIPCSITAENSHGSLYLKPNYFNNSAIYFEGGPLHGRYIVDNIHIHWGATNNNEGSEHAIDGKRFAAEAHIVSYNSRYGCIKSSMSKYDGLAVLSVVFEVSFDFI